MRLLDRPVPDVAEARQAMADIGEDQQRATRIIEQLRSGLRRGPRQPKPLNLNKVVEAAAGFARHTVEDHRSQVILKLAPELPLVLADETQMQQVIMNLLNNAVEAMSGFTIGDRKVEIRTGTSADGRQVLLEVEDTGGGVPENVRHRVFDAQFTTKSEGLGLGLAIVKSIVATHGGRIDLEDGARGALFRVQLPNRRGLGRTLPFASMGSPARRPHTSGCRFRAAGLPVPPATPTSSFSMARARCTLTVFSTMPSSAATCLFSMPRATRTATSFSRGSQRFEAGLQRGSVGGGLEERPVPGDRRFNGGQQFLVAERLGEKVGGPGFEGFGRRRHIAAGGDEDDGQQRTAIGKDALHTETRTFRAGSGRAADSRAWWEWRGRETSAGKRKVSTL